MSATESLASVDTICVDKTGTLTDGELRRSRSRSPRGSRREPPTTRSAPTRRAPAIATAPSRRSPSASMASPGRVSGEVPFSSEWKWSGLRIGGKSYVMGAPDVLERAGALSPPPAAAPCARARNRRRPAGRRLRRVRPRCCPLSRRARAAPALRTLALVVLEETLRPDAAETIAYMREQEVDLKLISGDARATVTAVAGAVGVPADAGTIEGPDLPDGPRGPGRGRPREHDLLPDRTRAEEGAGRGAARTPGATRR